MATGPFRFEQAESTAQVASARTLFIEYSEWLGLNLCFQNFDQELRELPGDYAPPGGRLLLAVQDNHLAGCIALRSLGENVCEMKRLFVLPRFRGQGLGRQLAERIIKEAKTIGYERMRLDTLPGKMQQAIAMYRSLGFKEIDAYYQNPVEDALFMELDLNQSE